MTSVRGFELIQEATDLPGEEVSVDVAGDQPLVQRLEEKGESTRFDRAPAPRQRVEEALVARDAAAVEDAGFDGGP